MAQFQTIKPDAGAYGIWGQQYAASVAAGTGNPGADIINQIALRHNAASEQQGYMRAILQAQQAQAAGQAATDRSDLEKTYLTSLAPNAAAGVAGASYLTPTGVGVDQDRVDQNDLIVQNKHEADAMGARADVLDKVTKAGFAPQASGLTVGQTVGQQYLTGPTADAPVVAAPYMNPGDMTGRQNANTNAAELPIKQLNAEANMVSAKKAPAAAGGGTNYIITDTGIPGMAPQVVVKTKDKAVADAATGGGGATPPASNANAYSLAVAKARGAGAKILSQDGRGTVIQNVAGHKALIRPDGSIARMQ